MSMCEGLFQFYDSVYDLVVLLAKRDVADG